MLVVLLLLFLVLFRNKVGDIRPAVLLPKPTESSKITPSDLKLTLSSDYTLGIFAEDLGNVRDLEFTTDGTLIASITSSGEIIVLPDKNNDNRADSAKRILTGLNNPHGVAFYNSKLYVVEENKLTRYNWNENNLEASLDKVLLNLPSGGRHFTRSLAFDSTGKLYISIGSTCDVCRENHPWLTSVVITDANGNNPQVFAEGLRNSVFIAVNPATNELWGTEMGRDFLGDNKPPDEINIIRNGINYGWPDCYGNKVPDTNFNQGATNATCNNTEPPIYEIAAHNAPLGLTFIRSSQFPSDWQGDLLIAYHGSWNRSTPTGYKIVRMKVDGNIIAGEEDFLSGFLQGSEIVGRPVDMAFDKNGKLYISDDKSGRVYIVSKKIINYL